MLPLKKGRLRPVSMAALRQYTPFALYRKGSPWSMRTARSGLRMMLDLKEAKALLDELGSA